MSRTLESVASSIYYSSIGIDEEIVDSEFAIDPVTMLLIMNIVIEIIKRLEKCHQDDNQKSVYELQNQSRYKNLILKRILRRRFGIVTYLLRGNQYCNAIWKTGNTIDVDKFDKLRKESHEKQQNR